MAAQCQNSPAGPADVTKQQLQNRRRANDLHALGMLSPPNCVANRRGPLGSGRGRERMRDFVKKIWWNPADFLHHLRCVARKMPLQFLKHALRVLQCEIALRATQIAASVKPTVTFVSAL